MPTSTAARSSSGSAAPIAPGEEEFAQLIRDIGASRVLMGSDFPWYDLDRTIEQVLALPLLSNEEKEGMLGAYAEQALGL